MKCLSYKKRFKSLFSFRKRRCSIYSGTSFSVLVTLKPTLFLLLSKLDHTMTSFTFVTLHTGPSVRADLLKKTYPYWVSPCLGQLLIFTTWALLSLWSTSYKQQNSKRLVRNQKEKKTSNIAEGYMGSFKIKSLAMLLSMRDWIIWYKKKLSVRMLNVFAYLSHNFLFRQIFGKNPLA